KSYPSGTMIFIPQRRKLERSTRLFSRKDGKVISAHALGLFVRFSHSRCRIPDKTADGNCVKKAADIHRPKLYTIHSFNKNMLRSIIKQGFAFRSYLYQLDAKKHDIVA
ncbi:MAG: hypothetical protein OXF84_14325, partial [Bacteroidetes bacterium]|nr:hypothetical protein [Bacteroidota bacterium]